MDLIGWEVDFYRVAYFMFLNQAFLKSLSMPKSVCVCVYAPEAINN